MPYLLLRSDEDGNPVIPIHDLDEFLENPREYAGIKEFLNAEDFSNEDNPQYWKEGQGLLLKYEVVVPKEKTKAWTL